MKEKIDRNNLGQRLAQLGGLSIAYNDALYDLVDDFVVNPYLKEMDERFGKEHVVWMPGGAGQTGSDTTAVVIGKPREIKPGFGQKLLRFVSPNEEVLKICLAGDIWKCTFNPEYENFALRMTQQFRNRLAGPLEIDV